MKRVHELRRFAQTAMTCTGSVGDVNEVFDEETGRYEFTFAPTWTGPCLIYPDSLDARRVMAGERVWTLSRYSIVLPAETPARTGQQFRVTDSPDDPALDGLILHLVDVPVNAWSVAQHCVGERTL